MSQTLPRPETAIERPDDRQPATDPAPSVRGVAASFSDRSLTLQRWTMAIATAVPLLGLVTAIVMLWGSGISGLDLGLLLGFYVFTGLGITVGFHRLFTHKSFSAPKPVQVVFAIAGTMALQGGIIDWVATHRRHHAYSDRFGDPHSPYVGREPGELGFWNGLVHAHLGWMFTPDGTIHEEWAPDLLDDAALVKIQRAVGWLVLGTFLLPAVIGGVVTGTIGGAISAFVWGSLVRIFLLHHVTWSINSICHLFGTKPFRSHDESRNNPVMALLAFGEGWHNAHHAFPASARHGLRWWEFDISWIVIRSLSLLRLARDIKLPSPTQLARKSVTAA